MRMRGRRITTAQKGAFLALLRQNGVVTDAAEGAGISRAVIYTLRTRDGAFAAAMDEAVAEACDRLEAEAWRRAVVGVEEPVYGRVAKDQDGEIGRVHKYSDTLMALLLKAHKPEKYRERAEVDHRGRVEVEYVNDWRDQGS